MTPDIAVVIPMFNSRHWIEETLSSVLAQTYPRQRLEIVVVDDGSSDDSVAVARAFIARHGMRGTVLESERKRGIGAARNRGWRAAGAKWIQFLDADDILAPNKIELQAACIPESCDDLAVICSSWQRLELIGDAWRPCGPVTTPELDGAVILKLVSLHAGFLGPTLMRRRFLEQAAGFSEDVKFAEDEHLMLKLSAAGGRFMEAPSPAPLFFIRQARRAEPRGSHIDVARQHMQNVAIAERMLREKRYGTLTPEDGKEISGLCDWSLSELYEHDRATFHQYLHWVRDIDPGFVPQHSSKLKLASRLLGYESAESLALTYRRLKAWVAQTTGWSSAPVGLRGASGTR